VKEIFTEFFWWTGNRKSASIGTLHNGINFRLPFFLKMAQFFSGSRVISGRITQYELALVSVFACIGIFNIIDFLTTVYALRMGLEEANTLLIGFANTIGLNLLDVLASIKIAFVIGSAALAMLGVRSENKTTRKMVLWGVFAFALVFAFVCLNNLYWILT
jgi:Domain of unknown function (DUF5658)